MKINVGIPIYNEKKGEAIIYLMTEDNKTSNVSIDFKKLLSLSNIASKEAVDFFLFSATIYGIDRFINRRVNSVDGWSRELNVKFPVRNVSKWNKAKAHIEEMVSFLTGDYWTFEFYDSNFTIPNKLPLENSFKDNFAKVSLFSGGLDSLIGLLNFLNDNKDEKVILASHYDGDMKGVRSDQEGLLKILKKEYPNRIVNIEAIKVTLDNTVNKEKTFRARSILFIGIAVIMADAKKIDIEVPENGTVSLNYPLNPSRRSACSTRTTHPNLINLIQNVWTILGITTKITNPFEFSTKGEMVSRYKGNTLAKEVFLKSNSCGKRRPDQRRGNPEAKHCGVCMPCVYRRAALHTIGLDKNDQYGDKIKDLDKFLTKKGQDVGACLEFIGLTLTPEDIKQELIINGVKDLLKLDQYSNVVVRTRLELIKWIKKNGNSYIYDKANLK